MGGCEGQTPFFGPAADEVAGSDPANERPTGSDPLSPDRASLDALFNGASGQRGKATNDPSKSQTPGNSKAGKKGLGWLEHADVGFVVFEEVNGRGTALVEGRLLQEGSTVGDYVVVSIDDEAIRLKEIAGTGTRIKRFVLKPKTEDWQAK